MLSQTLLRLGSKQLRRSLATVSECSQFSKRKENENHQEDRRKYFRITAGAVISGSVLYGLVRDEERRREESFLSRLTRLKPLLHAAEPTGGHNGGSSKSRRKEFNFIADLVEETGER